MIFTSNHSSCSCAIPYSGTTYTAAAAELWIWKREILYYYLFVNWNWKQNIALHAEHRASARRRMKKYKNWEWKFIMQTFFFFFVQFSLPCTHDTRLTFSDDTFVNSTRVDFEKFVSARNNLHGTPRPKFHTSPKKKRTKILINNFFHARRRALLALSKASGVFCVAFEIHISLCYSQLSNECSLEQINFNYKQGKERRENSEAWKTYSTVSVVKFTHACAVICFRLPMARVSAGRAPIYHRWKLIKQHYSRVPYRRMVIK